MTCLKIDEGLGLRQIEAFISFLCGIGLIMNIYLVNMRITVIFALKFIDNMNQLCSTYSTYSVRWERESLCNSFIVHVHWFSGLFEFYPFYFFFIPTGCGNEKYISGDFVFSHQNLCFILKVAILCLLLYLLCLLVSV